MTIAAIAATGCYSPELRDCIVACTATDECAPDQVCGSDGRCAAPELAGRCASMTDGPIAGAVDAAVDARVPVDATVAVDASPVDAMPTTGVVRIKISGRGYVSVDDNVSLVCSHMSPGSECIFTVPLGSRMLRAVAGQGFYFERWMGGGCAGMNPICTATVQPGPPVMVEAKFRNDNSGNDDDD